MRLVLILSRLMIGLVLLLTLSAGIVRLLAYNAAYYNDLHTLLQPPPDCPAPCFIGLQPGVTSRMESLTILENHPWVTGVQADVSITYRWYEWDWTDEAPATLAWSWDNSLWYHNDDLLRVHIMTTVTVQDVWHVFGRPDRFTLALNDDGGEFVSWFADAQFYTSFRLTCSQGPGSYWNAPVGITFCREADCAANWTAPHPTPTEMATLLDGVCAGRRGGP